MSQHSRQRSGIPVLRHRRSASSASSSASSDDEPRSKAATPPKPERHEQENEQHEQENEPSAAVAEKFKQLRQYTQLLADLQRERQDFFGRIASVEDVCTRAAADASAGSDTATRILLSLHTPMEVPDVAKCLKV